MNNYAINIIIIHVAIIIGIQGAGGHLLAVSLPKIIFLLGEG